MSENPEKSDSQFGLIKRLGPSVYSPAEYVDIPATELEEEQGPGLREYWGMVVRHRWTIVALGLSCAMIGLFVAKLPRVPMYAASTRIQLQNNELSAISINRNPFATNSPSLATQIMILESDALIAEVVKQLREKYKDDVVIKQNRFWEWLRERGIPVFNSIITQDRAIAMTVRSLNVSSIGQTQVIVVSCQSPDPNLAADFANLLVSAYSERIVENKFVQSQKITEFLERQLVDLERKLQNSQIAAQEYAEAHGIMTGTGTSSGTVASQKLSQIQQNLSAATTTRMTAEYRYERVKVTPLEVLSDVEQDPGILRLESQLAGLRQKMAGLRAIYTPEYPQVQDLQKEIDYVQDMIRGEQARLVNRLRNDYESTVQKEKDLETAYTLQAGVVAEQSNSTIQYGILNEAVATNRMLYQTVLQQVKEAGINSATQQGTNIMVIDEAQASFIPEATGTVQLTLMGLVGGLALGIGYSVIREKADSRLKSPGFATSQIHLTELGVIPSAHVEEQASRAFPLRATSLGLRNSGPVELITWNKKSSLVAESFRATVASILFSTNGYGTKVLIVTSPQMSEGKTTTVTNLGIALAEIGRRVVLIDGDMRHPRLHRVFNQPNEYGFSDMLDDQNPDESDCQVAIPTQIPNLDLIPSGIPKGSISKLLYSPRMMSLLEKLQAEYDVVLIDTPPILQVPDARVLGRNANGAILVFRAGSTSLEAATATRGRLADDGVHVLGCILNDWDPKVGGYGHGYYGTYYGKYYQNYSQRTED